jgi:hypothetical protein
MGMYLIWACISYMGVYFIHWHASHTRACISGMGVHLIWVCISYMGVHLSYGHACQVWTCILSISIYPTHEVHAYMLDARLYEVLRAHI